MSSVLPLFVNAQSHPPAIGGREVEAESLISVNNKDQLTASDQALASEFSHVLRELNDTSVPGKHSQSAGLTRSQYNTASNHFLTQKDFRSLESLLGSDTAEKILGGLQAFQIQTTPEDHLPPTPATLLSFQPAIIASLDEVQTPVRTMFQGSVFQRTGGDFSLGPVSQESAIGGKNFGDAQIPLSKASGSGIIISKSSLPEEALSIRTVVPSAKDLLSGSQQVGRSILESETLQSPILSQVSRPLPRPQNVQANFIPPVTGIQAEGPAGFTGLSLTNQIAEKSIHGNSTVLSDVSGSGIEHRTTVPADLLGETGLLAKGERGQAIFETSVKSLGLDPSGGQGLGNGMNHFSNSQSGSQQPSSFQGQGVGFRVLEERGQEFPAPVLQRLQMDVQVSENQRVHIDVGVHNRQVYTGLVLDHSVLRNLATQFVPQLENQLAEVDLELQEFSAEVRGEQEQEQEAGGLFNNDRSHEAHESGKKRTG